MIDFQLDILRDHYQAELAALPPEDHLFHHFSFIQKNADYFISLYRIGLIQLANEKFSTLLPDVMPIWSENPIEQEYRSAYIISGIQAIQRVWISRGCKESIEAVVAIAFRAQDKQVPIK